MGSRCLIVAEPFFPEFGNVLWKKTVRGEISDDEACTILQGQERVPLQSHSTRGLLVPAFEIAAGWHQSVYDSCYLALAVIKECTLATVDRKLYDRVKASPLEASVT